MSSESRRLALGEIKDSSSVDCLIERLQDPDWFIRLSSAAALEKIGDPRGREAVKPLMKDPDLVVRLRIERMLAAWKNRPSTPDSRPTRSAALQTPQLANQLGGFFVHHLKNLYPAGL